MSGPGRLAAGLDLGGTKISGVVLDEGGTIHGRVVVASPAERPTALTETLLGVVASLSEDRSLVGVGIGVAGMVEAATGVVRYGPNIAWRELPIAEVVADRTGLPCVVDNDANAAALAEARFGSGRGYSHVVMATVGTGIGGGIVADGALYRGASGFAAEIGHVIVEPGGPRCGCGNRGCWEQVAGGQALDRMAREEAAAHPDGAIARAAGSAAAAGPHVAAAAAAGDPAAAGILANIGRRLGEGLAGLANVLDPEVVVVGGGVADVGEPLLEPARRAFRDALEAPEHRPSIPVVQAGLGNDAGAVGAAVLALEAAP